MNADQTKSLYFNFLPDYVHILSISEESRPTSMYICEMYKTGAGGVLINKN